MKISDVTSKIIKSAEEITQKAKETYKESIKPKVNDVIEDAVEYATENYPKAKEKVQQVYTKVKNGAQETLYDINEAFKQFAMKKPKAVELKEKVVHCQEEYGKQKVKLALLKVTQPEDRDSIRLANKKLKYWDRELQKAYKEYNDFMDLQNAAQKSFDNVNNK